MAARVTPMGQTKASEGGEMTAMRCFSRANKGQDSAGEKENWSIEHGGVFRGSSSISFLGAL